MAKEINRINLQSENQSSMVGTNKDFKKGSFIDSNYQRID